MFVKKPRNKHFSSVGRVSADNLFIYPPLCILHRDFIRNEKCIFGNSLPPGGQTRHSSYAALDLHVYVCIHDKSTQIIVLFHFGENHIT